MTRPCSLAGTVAFAPVMTFSSGLGQIFFISLFNQNIRSTFALSHGQLGSLNFIGTFCSAVTIIRAGKLLDIIEIKNRHHCVCIGLSAAILTISSAQRCSFAEHAFFRTDIFVQGLLAIKALRLHRVPHRGIGQSNQSVRTGLFPLQNSRTNCYSIAISRRLAILRSC